MMAAQHCVHEWLIVYLAGLVRLLLGHCIRLCPEPGRLFPLLVVTLVLLGHLWRGWNGVMRARSVCAA